jgi:hypothetical protein
MASLSVPSQTVPLPAIAPSSSEIPTNPVPEKDTAVSKDGPPAVHETTKGEDETKDDEVDFAAIKKKKKKKAVFEVEESVEEGPIPAASVEPVSTVPAPATDVFYGEATMGSAIGPDVSDDMPPEIAKIYAKIASGTDLSNKERRAKKQWDEEQATKVPLKAGYGGGKMVTEGDEYGISAFSVSQSAKLMAEDSAAAENSKDILVENFTITAHKKELFKNATLKVAHGHRYGLVGPNGQGKTTILKHIAARELAIPPRISILYVEQEVVADETPAVQAVLRADKNEPACWKRKARCWLNWKRRTRRKREENGVYQTASEVGGRTGWQQYTRSLLQCVLTQQSPQQGKSCLVWVSPRTCRNSLQNTSLAAGACVFHLPVLCLCNPTCFCWMSRQTTLT